MRIRRLMLTNWCQHPVRDVTFAPGLTAILGPNGSGKSNFMGAIGWLLTGDNPNDGTKDENVYQLSPRGEAAYGELEFEHNSTVMTVRRNLRPTNRASTLQIGNEPTQVIGDKAINAALVATLGIDAKMVHNYVLVPQNEIFAFLTHDPKERALAFQRLFGMLRAEGCWKILDKHVSRLTPPSVAVELDQLRRDVAVSDAAWRRMAEEMDRLPELTDYLELQRADTRIIDGYQSLMNEQANLLGQVQGEQNALALLEPDLAAKAADLRLLREHAAGSKAAADAARAALANWQQYAAWVRHTQQLQSQRQALTAAAARNQPPVQPEDYLPVDSPLLPQMQQRLSQAEQLVQQFDGTGKVECPTCFRPTDTLGPLVEQAKRELPELRQQSTQLWARRGHSARWEQGQAAWAAWKQGHDAACQRLAELEAQVAEGPQAMTVDPDALEEQKTIHEDYVEAINTFQPMHDTLANAVNQKRGVLASLQQRLEVVNQRVAALGTDAAAEVAAAGQRIHQRSRQFERRQYLVTQMDPLAVQLNQKLGRLQELERQDAEGRRMQTWLQEIAEPARNAIHRNAAPRLVTQRKLRQIQVRINDILATFQTTYRVVADEELSFTANFSDGRSQPARRLSWGQKVVLALAFRIAVNSLFAKDVGLLALDEPTAYLDADHIRAFAPVVERLRVLAASVGLQCLMVTHEQELAPLFEAVIQL